MPTKNGHIRILVVDDEPVSQTIAEGKLLPDGYTLFFAENGADALAKLPDCRPHVILMDVMMPEMDGFTACRQIKSDPQWHSIPVIMVTALDDRDTLQQGFEAGANDFVSKAASAIELRARVRSMVKIKEQFDSLAQLLTLREDMANMMVHDMRNPLTSMIGYSQLLERLSLSEEQVKDIAQKIVSEGQRLNRFIDDMLLMAKMEENELQLNPTETDIVALVHTTIKHLHVSASAKNIALEFTPPPQPPVVPVDTNLFQRVLDNLVSNAIKYSPQDTTVHITVAPVSDGSHTARITIADEGPGISDEQKQTIFKKFDTGAISGNKVLQIGLGLAFSKMVVEAHHGTLTVTDNQPTGAIFVIEV